MVIMGNEGRQDLEEEVSQPRNSLELMWEPLSGRRGHERVLGAGRGGGGNEAELASYLIETSGGYEFSEKWL
jgi:hypothetical protein